MKTLSSVEIEQISGSGILKFILPTVIGFVIGGPAGAIYAAGTTIAIAGTVNLEHTIEKREIPTIEYTVNNT